MRGDPLCRLAHASETKQVILCAMFMYYLASYLPIQGCAKDSPAQELSRSLVETWACSSRPSPWSPAAMSNAPCMFSSIVKENLPANPCSAPAVRAVFDCFPRFAKIMQLHLTLSLRGCFLILVRKEFALKPSRFSISRKLTKTFRPMSPVKVGGFTRLGRARTDSAEEAYLFCLAWLLSSAANTFKTSVRPARTTPRTSSRESPGSTCRSCALTLRPLNRPWGESDGR